MRQVSAIRPKQKIESFNSQVPFGGNVTFTCKEGFFFEEDIELESHHILCESNGSFTNLPHKKCLSPKCEAGATTRHICTLGGKWKLMRGKNTFSDRYCPNPPPPPANGGITNWKAEEMNGTTPYGFKVYQKQMDLCL